MNGTHRVERCRFVMDEGCFATHADLAELIRRKYPFTGKTVVIEDKSFRVSGTPGNYRLTEEKEQ